MDVIKWALPIEYMDYHSLFKSALDSTYRLYGGTLKFVKFGKDNLKHINLKLVKYCSYTIYIKNAYTPTVRWA